MKRKLETAKDLKDILKAGGWQDKESRREFVNWVIKILKKNPNLWDLEHKTIPKLEEKGDKRVEALKVVVQIIKREKDYYGLKYEETKSTLETEEEKFIEYDLEETIEGVIGRVAITQETPSEPYGFHFWLKPEDDIYLEPGELIEVDIGRNRYAIGLVENIKASSEKKSLFEHFASWGLGKAEVESQTRFPIIKQGSAILVYRNDGKNIPLTNPYPLFKSKAETLEEAFSQMIKEEEDKVLTGFVKDGYGRIVPVYGSFSNIFGYKAGHVNITGKSGLAGKTSYALFLIASALSYSAKMHENERFDKTLGVIAFNVKERDLLDIMEVPFSNMDEALENLENEDPTTAGMWKVAYENGIDPIRIFRDARIFEPGRDFSYGLQDLISLGDHTILALFNPSDIDEKLETIVSAICEEYDDGRTTFDDLIDNLSNTLGDARGNYVNIGSTPVHTSTLSKFLNRMRKIIRNSSIIERRRPNGRVLDVMNLDISDLWIIDIEPLRDNEQRMVFYSVLSVLQNILPLKKRGENNIDGRSLADFPSRVSIFVDELNKFAPAGRSSSTIKEFIVDITARGRSVGLTLIGAEQFASQIEEGVLGNCSTFLIGRSEEFEISQKFYKRIPEGLKKRISYLKQGELIFLHDPLEIPLIINFP
ncbi:MAG: ATP-binding protein, partial [Aquificae bacterium]|nr:ATP-binding protein [Aquificota bacterium]